MSQFDAPTKDLESWPVFSSDEDPDWRHRRRIREWVARAVWISDRTPDLNEVEPTFESLLALIQDQPAHIHASEQELLRYLRRLNEPHPDVVLADLLAFLMATLRMPSLRAEAQQLRDECERSLAGPSRLRWTNMRLFERVIDSFSESWEEADFYSRYRKG